MSVTLSELRDRVGARFSDVEQVGESILRVTRRMGNVPFAVYYFDVAGKLPEDQETLTKYQDKVIGARYFEGEKSLQWNNYLYFVTDRENLRNKETLQAKELIENDRSYARKKVISEDDLDSELSPPVFRPTEPVHHTNISSVWVEHLEEAGLDKAILSNDYLPQRLALIESSSPRSLPKPKAPPRRIQSTPIPFIRSLNLTAFRPFPIQRDFTFGTVNLIFGANGSGKTSLLEAIELFYCGRTKRNPGSPSSPEHYDLLALLWDGETERVTSGRDQRLFRDRNLNWYGRAEVKSFNLYQSFSQFNFLDTDAAVHLADSSSSDIGDALSRLLVGPDASKIWRDMKSVNKEALVPTLRELRPRESEIRKELEELEKQLATAHTVKRESDSIRARLEEMLSRLGWSDDEGEKDATTDRNVELLAEFVPLVRQAAELPWIEAPVSISGLAQYCKQASTINENAEADIARLAILEKSQKRHSDALEKEKEALDLLRQAKRYINAGIPSRTKERDEQESIVAINAGWLASVDMDALGRISAVGLEMTVGAWQEAAVTRRSKVQELLTAARSEYSNFSKLRDQSLALLQELRQIAWKILKDSARPDECPLCHTQFGPGELAKHIVIGIDEHVESRGQQILWLISEQEAAEREASAVSVAAQGLKQFCEDAGMSLENTVRSTLAKIESVRQIVASARSQIEKLSKELAALEAEGLSASRLDAIVNQLGKLDHSLPELSTDAADRLISAITKDLAESSQALETARKEGTRLEKRLTEALGADEPGIRGLRATLSRRKERLVSTESIHAKLVDFTSRFTWPDEKPLAELEVEAESVRTVAAELQMALGKERVSQSRYAEWTKRIGNLRDELQKLTRRIKRLTEAKAVLDRLQRDFSLEKAMKSALQQNRSMVEAIFSHIHAPAEFRGLGSSWTTLVRKADGTEAKLTEISTGQRAAFALSIFLAQNAQLTVAPPVVLIDDPIAHVDDLNSLSFLDYLRDLALTGNRQIYFATASEKLASLFERKFDFLGEKGFYRFNLEREPRN